MATALGIFLALAIGYCLGVVGRRRTFNYQNEGEELVRRTVLANFNSGDYHLMNHITLSAVGGTTQVDHILVSRFGVFVIETKNYNGWIFANPSNGTWTQVLFRAKFKFQNPIIQNRRHVQAVRTLLDFLPQDAIQSAVVFVGEAEFKTDVPSGVYDLGGFVTHVGSCTNELMSMNRMHFCVGRLEAARYAISSKTDVEHIENIERKHGRKTY